jgi:hypothetical protein
MAPTSIELLARPFSQVALEMLTIFVRERSTCEEFDGSFVFWGICFTSHSFLLPICGRFLRFLADEGISRRTASRGRFMLRHAPRSAAHQGLRKPRAAADYGRRRGNHG